MSTKPTTPATSAASLVPRPGEQVKPGAPGTAQGLDLFENYHTQVKKPNSSGAVVVEPSPPSGGGTVRNPRGAKFSTSASPQSSNLSEHGSNDRTPPSSVASPQNADLKLRTPPPQNTQISAEALDRHTAVVGAEHRGLTVPLRQAALYNHAPEQSEMNLAAVQSLTTFVSKYSNAKVSFNTLGGRGYRERMFSGIEQDFSIEIKSGTNVPTIDDFATTKFILSASKIYYLAKNKEVKSLDEKVFQRYDLSRVQSKEVLQKILNLEITYLATLNLVPMLQ